VNLGKEVHHVPFIFGSLRLGGWGVFADVSPQPSDVGSLTDEPISSSAMNGIVLLEREIQFAAIRKSTDRFPIIPAHRTDRDGIGGLELCIVRVVSSGFHYNVDRFCAVSVIGREGEVNAVCSKKCLTYDDAKMFTSRLRKVDHDVLREVPCGGTSSRISKSCAR
jgi:hypothetical protein